MKRLNIFIDETGEFGFDKGASELYGVSFTFHEHSNSIIKELNDLNNGLEKIGYTNMIHMSDLIMKRGDCSNFSIEKRRSIFKLIYNFSRKVNVKYHSLIIDKRYIDNGKILVNHLSYEIDKMLKDNIKYFEKFDHIVMYYDNGQETLGSVLESCFLIYGNFEHRVDFDHKEKRLFQVSDMLTYVDKYEYKFINKMSFSKSEKYFFRNDEMRKIIKQLSKKRL